MVKTEDCGEQLTSFRKANDEILKLFRSFQLVSKSARVSLQELLLSASADHPECAKEFGQITAEFTQAISKEQLARITGSVRKVG